MKKVLTAALAALMSVSLAGCAKKITYTIPANYVAYEDEDQTLEEFVESETNSGNYTEVVANDDGSVTYTVTEKQHEAILDDFQTQLDDSISEIVDDPDYAITTINYNEDMTEFNVYIDEENATGFESLFMMVYCIYGNYYQYMNGVDEATADTTVNFINAVTEEVEDSIKMSDLEALSDELNADVDVNVEASSAPTASASAN